MSKSANVKPPELTEAEWVIMKVVWQHLIENEKLTREELDALRKVVDSVDP